MADYVRCPSCRAVVPLLGGVRPSALTCPRCQTVIAVRPINPAELREALPLAEDEAAAELPVWDLDAPAAQAEAVEVCRYHRSTVRVAHCTDCRDPLCANCVISFRSRPWCNGCKERRLDAEMYPKQHSTAAVAAFGFGIAASLVVCLGLFLGMVAVCLGMLSLVACERNRKLRGLPWACAGLVMGGYGVAVGSWFFWLWLRGI